MKKSIFILATLFSIDWNTSVLKISKQLKLLLVCIPLLSNLVVFGQEWSNYTIDNTSETINDDHISSIAIDKNGNIWFGTDEGGVTKYTGSTWITYNELSNKTINTITIAPDDKIWFGTNGYGIYIFDNSTWLNYTTLNSGLVSNRINNIKFDTQGNVWIATNNGVSKFNGINWQTITTENGLIDNNVSSIAIDHKEKIWFGTNNGVSEFNGTDWKNHFTLGGLDNVTSIAVDNNNYIWVGTSGPIYRYNGGSWTLASQLSTNYIGNRSVSAIVVDNQNRIWFSIYGYGDDILVFDSNKMTVYENPVIDIKEATCLAIDASGNKWIGSNGQGISKFDGSNWTVFSKTSGLANNSVTSSCLDNNGLKWFGTNAGLSSFNDTTWVKYDISNGLINNSIKSIAINPINNNLWICTNGYGVSRYDGISWSNYSTQNGLIDNTVSSILIDSLGVIWLGTNAGISKYDGKTWSNYSTSDGLVNNTVLSIAIDDQKNLWFGTNGGVSKFDGISTWTNFTTDDGLINNTVLSVAIDKKGTKWFGTNGGGVSILNNSTFSTFNTSNGLINNTVNCIYFDPNGIAWIGTSGGISKFNGSTWANITSSYNKLINNYVTSIFDDQKNGKWITTNAGISSFTCNSISTPVITLNGSKLISSYSSGNQWYVNDTLIIGATNSTYSASIKGNYYVIVNQSNCYSPKSNIIYFEPNSASKKDFNSINNFIISPNPSDGIVTIQLGNHDFNNLNIHLYDANNIEQCFSVTKQDNFIILNFQNLSPNFYFLTIQRQNYSITKKIIKL